MVVHRDQAEEMVIRLGHGLGRPMLVDVAYLKLFEVAPVWVGAGALTLALICGEAGF